MSEQPTPFQKKTLWNAITGISILVCGSLIVGLIWGMAQVLGFLQPVLVPLAMAGIIAYLLDPVVNFLANKGLGRLKSIGIVFAGFFLFVALMVLTIVPPLYKEAKGLVENRAFIIQQSRDSLEDFLQNETVGNLLNLLDSGGPEEEQTPPDEATPPADTRTDASGADAPSAAPAAKPGESDQPSLDTQTDRLFEIAEEHSAMIIDLMTGWASSGGKKLLGFFGFLFGMVMVPIYLFYFLKESAAIRHCWRDYIPLRASKFKDDFIDTLQEINTYLIAFFRGQVVVSLIDGVLTGIALKIVGLPYAIVIGLSLAILGIIPYIGIILTFIPAALIAFAKGTGFTDPGLSSVALIGVIFLVVQQFDGFVIQPKIVGDSTGLHPMTVIFSVLFWSLLLGGFLGALLAVPLTAAVKVLVCRLVWGKSLEQAEAGRRRRNADPPPEPETT